MHGSSWSKRGTTGCSGEARRFPFMLFFIVRLGPTSFGIASVDAFFCARARLIFLPTIEMPLAVDVASSTSDKVEFQVLVGPNKSKGHHHHPTMILPCVSCRL